MFDPIYLEAYETGRLKEKVEEALESLNSCVVCPLGCRVNRLEDEIGDCGVGRFAILSSYGPHFGEESVLVGYHGSGTVFFGGCNLRCVYCQNYDISQLRWGRVVDAKTLAGVFLEIQGMGCHNLNLVSPTHVVPQILEALLMAVEKGFRLPIVYNTGGYDHIRTLKLLDGIVDIYMPDTKYGDSKKGLKYSGVKNYFEINKRNLREMHRQVGDLRIEEGLAVRGLLIRHLVLPNNISDSEKVIDFIADELSKDSWLNLMDQYYPAYRAREYPELSRRITRREYFRLVDYAQSKGIHRGIPFDHAR